MRNFLQPILRMKSLRHALHPVTRWQNEGKQIRSDVVLPHGGCNLVGASQEVGILLSPRIITSDYILSSK